MATPFLKWAGGKRKLLPLYSPWLPSSIDGIYHEPFLGGGAMFFHLSPKCAILSDVNSRLINAYQQVRDDVEGLISRLKWYERNDCESLFYRVRADCPVEVQGANPEDAARFIYLNQTCFKGLYRVNSKGRFNVSYGHRKNPNICDEANLRACSRALQVAAIHCSRWEDSLAAISPYDFAFVDPPYFPVTEQKTNFNAYDHPFETRDQLELAYATHDAVEFGASVLLSNADTVEARGLYDRFSHFRLESISAHRNMAPTAIARTGIPELLVRSV